MGKLPLYVTDHAMKLSLAIPVWVGTMHTSSGWGVNAHHVTHWRDAHIHGLAV